MKIKSLFSFLALAGLLVSACSKTPDPVLPDSAGFSGRLSVIEIGDALFEMTDVRVEYGFDEAGKLDISMYDVSFSSKMPVTLNRVVLPDVPYTKSGATLTLSGTDIIPLMEMRGELVPYERYLCTDLTGTITLEKMVLSMKLGGFQTDYTGILSSSL